MMIKPRVSTFKRELGPCAQLTSVIRIRASLGQTAIEDVITPIELVFGMKSQPRLTN
jgi:hypothetical protein